MSLFRFLLILSLLLNTLFAVSQENYWEHQLQIAIDRIAVVPDSSLLILRTIINQGKKLPDNIIAKAFNVKGTIERDQGQYDYGAASYKKALIYYGAINDTLGLANVYNNSSQLEVIRNNYQKALDFSNQAIQIFRLKKKTKKLGRALVNKGNIFYKKEEFDEATRFFKEGISIAIDVGDKYTIMLGRENLAIMNIENNINLKQSIFELKKYYEYYKENNEQVYIAEIANKIGVAYLKLEDYESAIFYFDETINLSSENELFRLAYEAGNNLDLAKTRRTDKQKMKLLWCLIGVLCLLIFLVIYVRKQHQLNKEESKISRLVTVLGSTESILEEIASYIHNKYARDANAIKDKVIKVKTALGNISPELSTKLDDVCSIADRAYGYSRTTSYVVKPTKVKWEHWINANILSFVLDGDIDLKYNTWGVNEKSYSIEDSQKIFDILYNLISNIKKHAKAKRIRLNVREMISKLHIEVEDDGIGFDWPRHKGVGLMGVISDVESLNGTLDIKSLKQGIKGTHVKIIIPLKKEEKWKN